MLSLSEMHKRLGEEATIELVLNRDGVHLWFLGSDKKDEELEECFSKKTEKVEPEDLEEVLRKASSYILMFHP